MISLLNFKRRSYMIDTKNGTAIVSMPLTIPAFRNVIASYNTEEDALRALAYVANVAHYGSPGNIVGLTGEELKQDIRENLGLPHNFVETNEIKLAIIEYDKVYSKGVFGLFKELNLSFELTRNSIQIVNSSLEDLMKDVKKQKRLKTDSPDVLLGKIDVIMKAISQVRNLTNDLSKDVQSLREIEGILLSEEETTTQLYGGGTVPLSSKTQD